MMLRKRPLFAFITSALVLGVAVVYAQTGTPAARQKTTTPTIPQSEWGTLNFNTGVGSFKILSAGDTPAQGNLDMSFEGTVLVSGNEAVIVPEGDVRLELDRKDRAKKVYFGKGRLKVSGKYRAVQFFGRNLKARWNGFGIARLYGEFDKDLNTGEYWYEGQEKLSWQTGGMTVALPQPIQQAPKNPTVKPMGSG